jgi:hypothetical protein
MQPLQAFNHFLPRPALSPSPPCIAPPLASEPTIPPGTDPTACGDAGVMSPTKAETGVSVCISMCVYVGL